MSDAEMAWHYARAVERMLAVVPAGGLQPPTRDRARKFLMLALDHLS